MLTLAYHAFALREAPAPVEAIRSGRVAGRIVLVPGPEGRRERARG